MAHGRQRHGNLARAHQRQSSEPQKPPSPAPAIVQENHVRSRRVRELWRRVRLVGKYVAVFFSFLSGVILAIPKMSINPSVNLNQNDAFGTQFSVKNEGHVPAFDVQFICGPTAPFIQGVALTGPKTPAVWPGQTITRSCLIAAPGMFVDATVDISVNYKWPPPWLGWRSTQSAHFSGRHGDAGYFLVPDLN